jgi:hypothetical protein
MNNGGRKARTEDTVVTEWLCIAGRYYARTSLIASLIGNGLVKMTKESGRGSLERDRGT